MTAPANPRRLLLVRHAKSAWPDVPDHDRPLAPRGRRQAPLVGAWLRAHGHQPDLVLCSTARRARETWELMAGELEHPPRLAADGRIYGATAQALLGLVRETPPAVTTLLLVGHDPGIADLARTLPGRAAADALQRLRLKFPTGAVAVLAVPAQWQDLGPGDAALTAFVVPKELERSG